MNMLEFVLLVSAGIVFLAVGTDVGSGIWSEKQEERKAEEEKVRQAEAILLDVVKQRFEERLDIPANIVELKVVAAPPKRVGGRHRLTAA
jgi:hypothetical protein